MKAKKGEEAEKQEIIDTIGNIENMARRHNLRIAPLSLKFSEETQQWHAVVKTHERRTGRAVQGGIYEAHDSNSQWAMLKAYQAVIHNPRPDLEYELE